MKNKKTIYFDMDGVLCDFVLGVCKLFDFDYNSFHSNMIPGEYDLSKHLFFERAGYDNRTIESAINDQSNFWTELEPYPNAKQIVEYIDSNFENWYICTTPMNTPECYSGKVAWLHYHFGVAHDNIIMIKDKSSLADRNSILIDDCTQNYIDFKINGGTAYLYPRRWNKSENPSGIEGLKMFFDKRMILTKVKSDEN